MKEIIIENLEYFKKAKEQTERVKKALMEQDEILNAEDYAYLIELLAKEIRKLEDEVEFYTMKLKEVE